jgi:hypothetical protein
MERAAILDCKRVALASVQNRSSMPNRSIVREQFQLKIDLVRDQATLDLESRPKFLNGVSTRFCVVVDQIEQKVPFSQSNVSVKASLRLCVYYVFVIVKESIA